MDDAKALELALEYDQAARDSERQTDVQERGIRGSEYYAGIQTFTEEQKRAFESAGKPWHVFNEVLPIINSLTSTERGNRKDCKFIERRGGYACVAELITELEKHVMDSCDGDLVKSDVFLSGVRSVLGWYKLEIDYDREPVTGQLIVRSRPSLSVIADPTCTHYDLNDVKSGAIFVIDSEYIAKDKLKAMYPDKAKEIEDTLTDYIGRAGSKRGIIQRTIDYLAGIVFGATNEDEILFDSDLMNKWRCRHAETWIKEFVERTLVIDRRRWQTWWLDPKDKKDKLNIAQAEQLANKYPQVFEIKEKRSMPILHKVARIGELLLEHEEDPYNGMSLFPIIRYSPFGDFQYDQGVVDNLVGPQDEINKRMTNATHMLNQEANGVHVIGADSGAGYIDKLRTFGSSPNFVVELDKCGGSYNKMQFNSHSADYVGLGTVSKNYMEEISGVAGASRGLEPNRQESGALYRAKVQQSMVTNQVVFDRFDYSTKIMAYTMMEMLRRTETYTEDEIGYLVEDKALVKGDLLDEARAIIMQQSPPPQNPIDNPIFAAAPPQTQVVLAQRFKQRITQYQQQVDAQAVQMAKKKLFEQLKDYRTGKYSVVVTQSPNAPTTQMSNFFELSDLREIVPAQILAPKLIMATGIPKDQKDEMVEELKAMTAQVEPQVR